MRAIGVTALLLLGLTSLSQSGVWDLEQTPATATFYGAYDYDGLGSGLAVGDVNGDGQPDLLLGASGWDPDPYTQYLWGIGYLFYGGNLRGPRDLRRDSADFTIVGYPDGAHVGVSAAIGDVNGDGKGDILLGTAAGRGIIPGVIVFWGQDLRGTIELPGTPPDFEIVAPSFGNDIGSALTTGDVNGDGIDDIIIPAPFSNGPNNNRDDCGAVYIVYGRPDLGGRRDLAVDSADVTIYGADAYDELGFRGAGGDLPASVGDINGDGIGDLVAAAFDAAGPGNSRQMCGEAYVFYGGSLPKTWDLRFRPADLTLYGKHQGSSLANGLIGDINGDGYGDLLIGSPGASSTGEAYILYGGSNPPRGIKDLAVDSVDFTVAGIDTYDGAAAALALPDVNGDGRKDLVLGNPLGDGPNNTRRPSSGEAYLIFGGNLRGRKELRTSPPDWTFYGRNYEYYHLGMYIRGGHVTNGSNEEIIMVGGDGYSGPPGEFRDRAGEVHVFDLQDLIGVEAPGKTSSFARAPMRPRPNPFTSFATVPGQEGERFSLYDVSGRKVGTYRGDRIGEGLKAGVYFLTPEGKGARPLRVVKVK